jgi:hypothetical protein
MTIRPKTALSRLALAALFAAFGLAASAPVAQAQCQPNDCRIAETAAVEVQPAPALPLVAFPKEADRLVCENWPDCLLAEDAAPRYAVLAANPPAAVMCDTWPNCLVEPKAMRDAALR